MTSGSGSGSTEKQASTSNQPLLSVNVDPLIRSAPQAAQTLSPEELRAYRTMPYERYLQTARWRSRRNRALKLAEYHCQRCQAQRKLQVHHLSYARLGDERDEDLEVLCRGCHLGHHVNELQHNLGIYRRIVSDTLRTEEFTTVADLCEAVKCRCVRLNVPYRDGQVQAAIASMGDKRITLGVPRKYAELLEESAPHQPLSQAEAAGILAQLGAQGFVRSISEVPMITQREADKRVAAKMVVAEMLESIQRCEELERAAADAERKP